MTFGHLDFSWEHLFITERITNLLFHVICYTFAILYFNEIFEPFVNYHHHSSYWIFSYFWFEMPHLSCVMDWVFTCIWYELPRAVCTIHYFTCLSDHRTTLPSLIKHTHTHTIHHSVVYILGNAVLLKFCFPFLFLIWGIHLIQVFAITFHNDKLIYMVTFKSCTLSMFTFQKWLCPFYLREGTDK